MQKAPSSGTMEQQIFDYQNYARTNPSAIAAKIAARLAKETNQNAEPALSMKDAIAWLATQPAVSALSWNRAIMHACMDHARDQASTKQFSHTGSDGSSMSTRIARYGDAQTTGENLAMGYTTAEDFILALIIDSGIPTRGHRINTYLKAYNYGAVGYRTDHPNGPFLVLNFAGSIVNKETGTCPTTQPLFTSSGMTIKIGYAILTILAVFILF